MGRGKYYILIFLCLALKYEFLFHQSCEQKLESHVLSLCVHVTLWSCFFWLYAFSSFLFEIFFVVFLIYDQTLPP